MKKVKRQNNRQERVVVKDDLSTHDFLDKYDLPREQVRKIFLELEKNNLSKEYFLYNLKDVCGKNINFAAAPELVIQVNKILRGRNKELLTTDELINYFERNTVYSK